MLPSAVREPNLILSAPEDVLSPPTVQKFLCLTHAQVQQHHACDVLAVLALVKSRLFFEPCFLLEPFLTEALLNVKFILLIDVLWRSKGQAPFAPILAVFA